MPQFEKVSYEDLIRQEAQKTGVRPELALAVAKKESSLKPGAVGDQGKAIGLFQLHRGAAKDAGIANRSDPMENIRGGVRYLKQMLDQHQGNEELALASYNAGPGTIAKSGGQIPNRPYVNEVMAQAGPVKRFEKVPQPVPSDAKIGPGPSAALRFSRVATPTIGAIAGGMKGAALGSPLGPLGTFAGGVVGAGLGAGGAELLQSGWERLVGEAPPTIAGIGRRVSSATQTGMVGEGIGRGVAPIVSAVARPFMRPMASKLEPYAQEALETFARPGQSPAVLPAEISKSRILDVSHNIAEGSFLGGARISAVKESRQGIAEAKILSVLDDLGPRTGTKSAGRTVVTNRKEAIKRFRDEEKPAWDTFRDQAKDIPMETPNLDTFIAELQGQEAGSILPNAGVMAAQRVAALSGEVDSLVAGSAPRFVQMGGRQVETRTLPASVQEAIVSGGGTAGPPPTVTSLSAGQFQKTVSNLGTLMRRIEKAAKIDPTKNGDLGIVKHLYNLAQKDLDAVLAKANTGVQESYESARTLSRLGNEQLFNESVRSIVKGAPEKIVGKLLQRDNSTAIQAVREAVGEEAFARVQSAAMTRIIRPQARTDHVNWGQVADRLDGLGDDTVKAMFPGSHATEIRRISRLMLNLSQQSGGIGKVATQLTQGGAVIGLATGRFQGAARATLITPWLMSRIFTNQRALRWLSTGLRAPQGSQEAITAAAQLSAFLARDEPEQQDVVAAPPPRSVGAGPVGPAVGTRPPNVGPR